MLKRFIPIFILAFITGLLFRLGDQYGIAVLRMFGTQGIVIIGILGARLLRSIQREDGIREVEAWLGELDSKDVKVTRIGAVGSLPFWMLETRRGKILLGTSDVPHSTRETHAMRRFGRHVRMMVGTARNEGFIQTSDSFRAVLVLLRRGVPKIQEVVVEEGTKVTLVNPESLTNLHGAQVA